MTGYRIMVKLLTPMVLGWLAARALGQEPEIRIQEHLKVERIVVDVRVTQANGSPVQGLVADDFVVTTGGRTLPVISCQWFDSEAGEGPGIADGGIRRDFQDEPPTADQDAALSGGEADPFWDDPPGDTKSRPDGRLIVFFVQQDLQGARNYGLVRMTNKALEMLDGLVSDDYVAVVSFDSHFKIHLDFTRQKGMARKALQEGLFRGGGAFFRKGEFPSLMSQIDPEEALDATTAERALTLTGRGLQAFGGPKTLVFLGWGLGVYRKGGVVMVPEYGNAVQALNESMTSVYSLDVTMANFHSLEVGLQNVAHDTGGFYARTFEFVDQAIPKVLRFISGFYLLTFEKPAEGVDPDGFKIDLRGKQGQVHVRYPYNRL